MTEHKLMHGHNRRPSDRCRGWLVQEKFDGWRALWTGSKMITREGNEIPIPAELISKLPAGIPLDCELYAGKGGLRRIPGLISSGDWSTLRLVVFDAPNAPGGYAARHAAAVSLVGEMVAPYCKLESIAKLREDLSALWNEGGEGFMLRNPNTSYEFGKRTRNLIKFKRMSDAL